MASFLAQWNPDRCDGYAAFAAGSIGDADGGWSFAAHKAAKIGDDIYLRRSGADRPGIVLRGRISGFSKPTPSFEGQRVSPRVCFDIEQLAHEDSLPLVSDAKLFEIDPDQAWRSQSSGISIRPETAAKLHRLVAPPVADRLEAALGGLPIIEQIAALTRLAADKATSLELRQ